MRRMYSLDTADVSLFKLHTVNKPITNLINTTYATAELGKKLMHIRGHSIITRTAELASASQMFELCRIDITPALMSALKPNFNVNIDGALVELYGVYTANFTNFNLEVVSCTVFVTVYKPTNSLCINIKTNADNNTVIFGNYDIFLPFGDMINRIQS